MSAGTGMRPSALSAAQVARLAAEHAEFESRGELEPVLATLVEEPVFEFHPPGGALVGMDRLRRYYRHFIDEFMPRVEDSFLLGEWASERAVVYEYQVLLRAEGAPRGRAPEEHQLASVMYASGDKLGGERIYGSESLLRQMLGPFADELEPIRGRSRWALDR